VINFLNRLVKERPTAMIGILIGLVLLFVLISLRIQWNYVFEHDSFKRHIPVILKAPQAFLGNPRGWLDKGWASYKQTFIQQDGRVVDFYVGNSTTSEGQSYALQQAVWMKDKDRFDAIWNWTSNNLQIKKESSLFAWKWGANAQKKWVILDESAASDADQDIAFALLMAYKRWNDPRYKEEALAILDDLWAHEVTDSAWGPVLLPGDWHRFHQETPDVVLINPSYLAPYLYRVFAQVDPSHDWEALVQTSYRMWDTAFLATESAFPPDWVWFSRSKGEVYGKEADKDFPTMTSNYGYEACRLPWRLYLDVALTRAYGWENPTGEKLVDALEAGLAKEFPEVMNAQGGYVKPFESKAREAGFWPMLILENDDLYYQHASHYNWGDALNSQDYYARNWLWFAVWLQVFKQRSLAPGYLPNASYGEFNNVPLLDRFTFALDS